MLSAKSKKSKDLTMPLLIAHRGASSLAPENTISSIQLAINLNVNFVEIDIHLSKDNIPVVIHDPTTQRTTNSQSPSLIHNLTLKEIQSLDAGSWFHNNFSGEKIPSLHDVLSLDFKSTGLMIEIKESPTPPSKIVSILLNTLSLHKNLPPLKIGSLSPDIVLEIQKQSPNFAIGIIENNQSLHLFKNLHCLAIWYPLINPMLIKNLHENNTLVWAFTVDNPQIAQFLLSINTDGIITNNPQAMLTLK